jgi:uncharacterized protein YaeQ
MLYRFQIELADIDHGVYETLEVRTAQHPSEKADYLLTRVLAYALSYRAGLEFSAGGLGDPDAPALRALGAQGSVDLWIEIGNPSTKRLHKASKAANEVRVYTYRSLHSLLDQLNTREIHRAAQISIFALEAKFLAGLEGGLQKSNKWSVMLQEGQLEVGTGTESFQTEVQSHFLA